MVEKSIDGLFWKTLGNVAGHGTTIDEKSYQIIDNQPVTGINFYRLQQFDFDGRSEYSPIVTVGFYQNSVLRAYPNPVLDDLTIAFFSEKNTDATLDIFDANGRIARSEPMPIVRGSLTFEMKIGELPGGVYFMQLTENGGKKIAEGRFVKD